MEGEYTQYSFNVYKLPRFGWLGWVVTYRFTGDQTNFCGEDSCSIKIAYGTFGFRRSRVDARIKKWAKDKGIELKDDVINGKFGEFREL